MVGAGGARRLPGYCLCLCMRDDLNGTGCVTSAFVSPPFFQPHTHRVFGSHGPSYPHVGPRRLSGHRPARVWRGKRRTSGGCPRKGRKTVDEVMFFFSAPRQTACRPPSRWEPHSALRHHPRGATPPTATRPLCSCGPDRTCHERARVAEGFCVRAPPTVCPGPALDATLHTPHLHTHSRAHAHTLAVWRRQRQH